MIALTNMTPAQQAESDEMVNAEPDLPTWTILGREFDIDELRDVVNHGMSAGVGGFIYTRECVDAFDENDDLIQDYLSDWVHDNIGGDESSFSYFAKDCEDISQLKTKLVWAFVELKSYDIVSIYDHEFFN